VRTLLRFVVLAFLLLSACATPTSMPRPTKAPSTKTPSPHPQSTRTPRPVSVHACVTDSTIRIRKGPGTDYEQIGGMVSGTCMTIQGRNRDSSWVYMVSEDGKQGWVAVSLLTIEGNLSRVSVRSDTGVLSLAPTAKVVATSTRKPVVQATNTPQQLLSRSTMLCAEATVGERVSCQLPRAYCDYLPNVNGSPTFCNDRPYPNHDFQMVVWGEDWSALDGTCIVISGYVELYRGKLQIEPVSPSQVAFCE
jgi:hypothetical protein